MSKETEKIIGYLVVGVGGYLALKALSSQARPERYPIKIAVIQFGEPYPADVPVMPSLDELKKRIEKMSKFSITMTYNKYSKLDFETEYEHYQEEWGGVTQWPWMYKLTKEHIALLPKTTHFNIILFGDTQVNNKWGGMQEGNRPDGLYQPNLFLPIGHIGGGFEDNRPPGTDPDWKYPLVSGGIHEFLNGCYGIVNTKLKLPGMPTVEGCGEMGYTEDPNDTTRTYDRNWVKCRTAIFDAITDPMYQAISDYNPLDNPGTV